MDEVSGASSQDFPGLSVNVFHISIGCFNLRGQPQHLNSKVIRWTSCYLHDEQRRPDIGRLKLDLHSSVPAMKTASVQIQFVLVLGSWRCVLSAQDLDAFCGGGIREVILATFVLPCHPCFVCGSNT